MIKIVDLFSGVGGMTYGFLYQKVNTKFQKRDNVKIVFANEYDQTTAEAFSENFPDIKMINSDIKSINRQSLQREHLLDEIIEGVDLIIGGPPCQSYSLIGARKNDDRSKMYNEFTRMLRLIKPKMFVFENVVGLLSMKDESGNKIIDNIKQAFLKCGYTVEYEILNAAHFGVPQTRERVFIVGIRKDIKKEFVFPESPLQESEYISLKEAISDLPKLRINDVKVQYSKKKMSEYQVLMKNGTEDLRDHMTAPMSEKLIEIMENLGEGESKKDINRKVEKGEMSKNCYLTSGFHNTYGRLWWNRPGVTLTNKFTSMSSTRCVHPRQNRTLSIREGARIQSFPDTFIFKGCKTEKIRQIGNAVPPLLAEALADTIYDFLKEI